MIVVDASVGVKWFVNEPDRAAARGVIESGEALVAPDFVVLEFLSVLRRKQRLKLITDRRIVRVVCEIRACFSELVSAGAIAGEAFKLSIGLDRSIYDCCYLACAIIKEPKLITADEAFLKRLS